MLKKLLPLLGLVIVIGGGYYTYQYVLDQQIDPLAVPLQLQLSVKTGILIPDTNNETSKALKDWLTRSPQGWKRSPPASYANMKCLTARSVDSSFIAVICPESARLMMGADQQYIKALNAEDKEELATILRRVE